MTLFLEVADFAITALLSRNCSRGIASKNVPLLLSMCQDQRQSRLSQHHSHLPSSPCQYWVLRVLLYS